jgi:hypothetical protein
MTPDLLRKIGEALYGGRWQSALAHEFEINERTMRRWLSGMQPVPPDRQHQLREMVISRGAQLSALARELSALD